MSIPLGSQNELLHWSLWAASQECCHSQTHWRGDRERIREDPAHSNREMCTCVSVSVCVCYMYMYVNHVNRQHTSNYNNIHVTRDICMVELSACTVFLTLLAMIHSHLYVDTTVMQYWMGLPWVVVDQCRIWCVHIWRWYEDCGDQNMDSPEKKNVHVYTWSMNHRVAGVIVKQLQREQTESNNTLQYTLQRLYTHVRRTGGSSLQCS